MKRNVVLLTNCGKDLTSQWEFGRAETASQEKAFDILSLGLDDINLAIVDLGANTQSLAIIEALSHTKPAPPVIALVDEKDAVTMPELHRHGAAGCLQKPFCADELARLIELVCSSHQESPSCDKWGHPCPGG